MLHFTTFHNVSVYVKCPQKLVTARKRSLGQGHIFRSVCQEFCRGGGIPECIAGGIPACLAGIQGRGSPGPQPGGKLRGLARGVSGSPTPGGGFQPHTQGVSMPTPGGGWYPGPHLGGMVSRPKPRGRSPGHTRGGCVSQHALRQPPPVDSYCRSLVYWNAFL